MLTWTPDPQQPPAALLQAWSPRGPLYQLVAARDYTDPDLGSESLIVLLIDGQPDAVTLDAQAAREIAEWRERATQDIDAREDFERMKYQTGGFGR